MTNHPNRPITWGQVQMCNCAAQQAARWHRESVMEIALGQFERAMTTQSYARNAADEAMRFRLKILARAA